MKFVTHLNCTEVKVSLSVMKEILANAGKPYTPNEVLYNFVKGAKLYTQQGTPKFFISGYADNKADVISAVEELTGMYHWMKANQCFAKAARRLLTLT